MINLDLGGEKYSFGSHGLNDGSSQIGSNHLANNLIEIDVDKIITRDHTSKFDDLLFWLFVGLKCQQDFSNSRVKNLFRLKQRIKKRKETVISIKGGELFNPLDRVWYLIFCQIFKSDLKS